MGGEISEGARAPAPPTLPASRRFPSANSEAALAPRLPALGQWELTTVLWVGAGLEKVEGGRVQSRGAGGGGSGSGTHRSGAGWAGLGAELSDPRGAGSAGPGGGGGRGRARARALGGRVSARGSACARPVRACVCARARRYLCAHGFCAGRAARVLNGVIGACPRFSVLSGRVCVCACARGLRAVCVCVHGVSLHAHAARVRVCKVRLCLHGERAWVACTALLCA